MIPSPLSISPCNLLHNSSLNKIVQSGEFVPPIILSSPSPYNLSHNASMNKMVHSGKTLLQTKADRAKGNAVGQSDIPDEDDGDDQEDDGVVCCNDDDYDDN